VPLWVGNVNVNGNGNAIVSMMLTCDASVVVGYDRRRLELAV